MKTIIIFNKNLENLDLLINSLNNNVSGKFEYFIVDLNNKLKGDEFEYIIKTENLKESIISILQSNLNDIVTIIDENKFCYDKFNTTIISDILLDQDLFCFSLSLGKNVTHCSNMNCDNVLISEKEENGIIYWDWSKHYMDFGYPLNLDGTVFRSKELLKLIKNINFEDSIELENALQIFDNYPKNIMCSFENNKIIELIFENKEEIINFNIKEIKIDRSKFVINSKIKNEIIN